MAMERTNSNPDSSIDFNYTLLDYQVTLYTHQK